jgi:hypothetical protein
MEQFISLPLNDVLVIYLYITKCSPDAIKYQVLNDQVWHLIIHLKLTCVKEEIYLQLPEFHQLENKKSVMIKKFFI